MKFSIIIPHWRTGKMTAYTISQIQKLKGKHKVNIIVVDNSNGEGTEFIPADSNVMIVNYPTNLMQSHGIAFDYALQNIPNISEYFITLESDSFPTQDNWLDYYVELATEGYDMAGSRLRLSGGEYLHPAGAMYRKSNWKEAMDLVENYNSIFHYNPNSILMPEFAYHGMESKGEQDENYKPIAHGVFHQGMAFKDETLSTYGQRTIYSEVDSILIPEECRFNYQRVGYEPGQWFSYWHYAMGKKVKQIDTEIEWMPNRVNQQQEYTLTSNGVKHLWGVSAYHGASIEELSDIVKRKNEVVNELYNTI
tara:strand:- start:1959 stop:2882 length:924 start_codon:yes stop_codon:yes gene_type:complete